MKKAIVLLTTVLMILSVFGISASASHINMIAQNRRKPNVNNDYKSMWQQQSVIKDVPVEQPTAPKSTVVAVMYHKISENPAEIGDFCITPETFEKDIIWFVDNGYSFCFASQVDEILAGELPYGKYVVITFDDGYESDYRYALPILKKYNAQATFFVIGSGIGTNDRISEESLKLLASSNLVEIGSHSNNLHNLSVEEMKRNYSANKLAYIVGDFQQSVAILEKITGTSVRTLSFPNGIWSKMVVAELRNVGFEELFSSELDPIRDYQDRYGRVNRYSGVTIDEVLKNHIS